MSPLADKPSVAMQIASEKSPYMAQLIRKSSHFSEDYDPDSVTEFIMSSLDEIPAGADVSSILRKAKIEIHLACAAGDLSGSWPLETVTGTLSKFADRVLDIAMTEGARKYDVGTEGFFAIAMGKMGANELNYSSDIDFILFYDPEVFAVGQNQTGISSRIVKHIVQLLDERTVDGYVFRTDLRLRPDPSSTPPVVSIRMAETYYETVGQNWERMAWIKARPCSGDIKAGEEFVKSLSPFIWRKYLDYTAISEVQAIKKMINEAKGAELEAVDPSVKLSPGGIREIEMYAQTQQIIFGGRVPSLRGRETRPMLAELADRGMIDSEVAGQLDHAYEILRDVEHRIQMRLDEHSHTVPKADEARSVVAKLCGIEDVGEFDRLLSLTRQTVHKHYIDLYGEVEEAESDAVGGNLVFTGVDDDPGTVENLKEMGYQNPSYVIDVIRQWHRGSIPATIEPQSRQILTAMLPDLIKRIGATEEADIVFQRFVKFFEGLSSGVQVLPMLKAQPKILDDLIGTLSLAQRLAKTLGRRPQLLENLIEGYDPVERVERNSEIGPAMDITRSRHRDMEFLIGHRLLHGLVSVQDAAEELSDLAEDATIDMAAAAERETVRKFGKRPGDWVVLTLGRLGGREMRVGSDLDLVIIYEPYDSEAIDLNWYTRFSQRLITALSVPTDEGTLYEVDMRLRPAGASGPVAVSLSAYEQYQRTEAWTWEHMSLTRMRPIVGSTKVASKVMEIAEDVIMNCTRSTFKKDIADMREKLFDEKQPKGKWDLKMSPGGKVDIEFIAQYGILNSDNPAVIQANTTKAIDMLNREGQLIDEEAALLIKTLQWIDALQQIIGVAVEGTLSVESTSKRLRDRLAKVVGVQDFDALEIELFSMMKQVADIRARILGV